MELETISLISNLMDAIELAIDTLKDAYEESSDYETKDGISLTIHALESTLKSCELKWPSI